MSKKENANQKLKKWMNHTYIETEDKKKPFFEGYKPNYYFKNAYEDLTEEQIKDILSKAILTGKDKFASCDSLSKPITLDDLEELAEKLIQLPPSPIEMEVGSKFTFDILFKNVPTTKEVKGINLINGISVSIVEGTDLKFNQMKMKYSDGSDKVIDVFTWNDKINYDYLFNKEDNDNE